MPLESIRKPLVRQLHANRLLTLAIVILLDIQRDGDSHCTAKSLSCRTLTNKRDNSRGEKVSVKASHKCTKIAGYGNGAYLNLGESGCSFKRTRAPNFDAARFDEGTDKILFVNLVLYLLILSATETMRARLDREVLFCAFLRRHLRGCRRRGGDQLRTRAVLARWELASGFEPDLYDELVRATPVKPPAISLRVMLRVSLQS